MRQPAVCLCKTKGADQLPGNCAADQRLSYSYIDSTIPLLPKSEVSSCGCVIPGLCWTWSETLKKGLVVMQLLYEPCCEKTGLRGF